MSDEIETIKVKHPDGFMIINADDFDPARHERFGADPETARIQGTPEELGTDSGDQFSDEQLRDVIETITGTKPHHKTGRAKLVDQYNELNAS